MSGKSLNEPTNREIRYQQRCQKKRIEYHRKLRKVSLWFDKLLSSLDEYSSSRTHAPEINN